MRARTYRMTVSSTWYDERRKAALEHEMHFKVARGADIRKVRKNLAKRGVDYFQRVVHRQSRRWIPKRKIKVRFERERPAIKTERRIGIEARSMEFRGRQWKAYPLPSRVIQYGKKKYRRRIGR